MLLESVNQKVTDTTVTVMEPNFYTVGTASGAMVRIV